jgi:hypothetical protein
MKLISAWKIESAIFIFEKDDFNLNIKEFLSINWFLAIINFRIDHNSIKFHQNIKHES